MRSCELALLEAVFKIAIAFYGDQNRINICHGELVAQLTEPNFEFDCFVTYVCIFSRIRHGDLI